jgi:hypothetical protein
MTTPFVFSFRRLPFCALLLSTIFSNTACMSSAREENLRGEINKLRMDLHQELAKVQESTLGTVRSTTEDASRKVQGAHGEVEDLRRQLALTQGAVDELQTRFARVSDIATRSANTQDVAIRLSEIEESLEKSQRRIELLLMQDIKRESGLKSKTSLKYKTADELEKAFVSLFASKEYKKTLVLANQVLAADVSPGFVELALRFRAEAAFAQQDYFDSAYDFGDFVERFPKSSKFPRALLLAGDSFVYLHKFKVAKSFYQECVRVASDREECRASRERLAKLPVE